MERKKVMMIFFIFYFFVEGFFRGFWRQMHFYTLLAETSTLMDFGTVKLYFSMLVKEQL